MAKQVIREQPEPVAAPTNALATVAKHSGMTALAQVPTSGVTFAPSRGESTPYMMFLHPLSPQYGRVVGEIPGAAENDVVLIMPTPIKCIKLEPARFFLLSATKFYAKMEKRGDSWEVAKASFTESAPDDGSPRNGDDAWREQIETVLLVFAKGTLIPTSGNFRTTKTGCVHRAVDALLTTTTDPEAWAAQPGAGWKETLAIPVAWARFVSEIKLGKTTKAKGGKQHNYTPASSLIFPTAHAEAILLAECMESAEFKQNLANVQARYESRVADARAKSA